MKKKLTCAVWGISAWCLLPVRLAVADTLVFPGGRAISGTIIQTNGDDVLLLTRYAAYKFSLAGLKEIRVDPPEALQVSSGARLPDMRSVALRLSKQPWASGLSQIPATVVDKGVLRNVPYLSFRCGDNYEVNVYGDLDHPAGIEVGVYRKLLDDGSAKSNCLRFVSELLGRPADRDLLRTLRLDKDQKTVDGVTFEITPPTDEDAYLGWWVSVYSEAGLKAARASDQEMASITVPKEDVAKGKQAQDWSAQDLKFARSDPTRISFATKSGLEVTNAKVRPYVDGVNLIWRDDNGGGGIVSLADLPEEVRMRFGYDSAKSASAEAQEKDRRAQEAQARAAWAAQAAALPAVSSIPDAAPYAVGDSGSATYVGAYPRPPSYSASYSGGGSVYVHGYTRKDGTYVSGYTRRR